jgi:hypothetical protein
MRFRKNTALIRRVICEILHFAPKSKTLKGKGRQKGHTKTPTE